MKKNLRFLYIAIGILFISTGANSQVISVGNDTLICPGQSATITATIASLTPIPPTNVFFCNAGNPSALCDDYMANAWSPLGFPFTFYGNTYTQVLISSNGYITFTGTPGSYSPWGTMPIPNPGAPVNAIMSPWQDVYPGYGNPPGLVRYKTVGTAPNRVFVVEYLDIPMFSCGSNFCFGTQIKLYEGTNVIETHIAFRNNLCTQWNGGNAVHGIQNATGTIAHPVAGRNNTNWPASMDGRRFTPTSPTAYTITTIPFNPTYMPAVVPPGGISWTANGVNAGTGTSITVTPNVTTNYVGRLNYSSCGQVSFFTDTMVVTVGTLPMTISPAAAICIGESTQLLTSSTTTGATFTWSPAATLNADDIPNPVATPTATTTYTVTGTNGLCTATRTVTVTVNPLPVIGFNAVDPYICPTDSILLTATGGIGYSWSPVADLSTPQSSSTYASPLTNTLFQVIVTDANGCVDSATNNVLMHVPPTVSITMSEPSVCPNYSAVLTGNGASTYVWSPATGLDYTTTTSPTATLSATQQYTVIGTDVNGCRDTAMATLVVDPLPVVSFTATDNAGCEPVVAQFTNGTTISSGSLASYLWNFEGHGTSAQVNPTATFPNEGAYNVQLIATSDSGCVDSITLADFVNVYNIPTANFNASPQPTTIGDPEISFTNTSSADVNQWNWDFAGLGSAQFSDPTYSFPYADTFLVTLIVSTQYGCLDTISDTIIIDDLTEIWIPNSFTPDDDGLNDLWFPVGRNLDTKNVMIEVSVFDRWGQNVFYSNTSDKPWNGQMSNGQSDLPQGSYIYKVYFINEKGIEKTYMGNITMIK